MADDGNLNARLTSIEARLDTIGARLDGLVERVLSDFAQRLAKAEQELLYMRADSTEHAQALDAIKKQLDRLTWKVALIAGAASALMAVLARFMAR